MSERNWSFSRVKHCIQSCNSGGCLKEECKVYLICHGSPEYLYTSWSLDGCSASCKQYMRYDRGYRFVLQSMKYWNEWIFSFPLNSAACFRLNCSSFEKQAIAFFIHPKDNESCGETTQFKDGFKKKVNQGNLRKTHIRYYPWKHLLQKSYACWIITAWRMIFPLMTLMTYGLGNRVLPLKNSTIAAIFWLCRLRHHLPCSTVWIQDIPSSPRGNIP